MLLMGHASLCLFQNFRYSESNHMVRCTYLQQFCAPDIAALLSKASENSLWEALLSRALDSGPPVGPQVVLVLVFVYFLL